MVIVGDLMTTLERYIRLKPGIRLILLHFVYRTPPFVYQGLHLVMLMSTILLFVGLSRSNELTALKAGGVSLYRVEPAGASGLAMVISVTSLGFQEYVMPWMNRRATEIDEAKIKRRTMPELRKRTEIWYRGREDGAAESRIYHIGLLDPGNQQMNNVTVLSLGSDFTMRRRWDAREMRWVSADDAWRLGTGVRREFRSGQPDRAETFKEQSVKLPERYQDFAQVPAGARRDELQGAAGVHRAAPGRRAQGREVHRRPPVEDRPSRSPTRSWCSWASRSPSSPRGAAG